MSAATPKLTLRYPRGDQVSWIEVKPAGVRIGRKESCEIVLASSEVSREHAEIRLEGGHWLLRDLGSANGTWVEGVQVTEHALGDGERIRIDGFEILCWLSVPGEGTRIDPGNAAADAKLDMGDFDALVSQVLDDRDAALDDRTLVRPPAHPAPGPTTARAHDARGILQMLHSATSALMENDELDGTLERVVDLVFERLPAERCFVLLVDPESGRLMPRIERAAPGTRLSELRISRNIAEAALQSQQAVLVRDTSADQRFANVESILLLRICSAMCAPLCHKGRVGGLIYVDRMTGGEVFTTTQLGVLSILATISAAAVERAQMRANLEHERRVRERLGRYHAPNVVEHIVRSAEHGDGAMQTEEREVSVLFADLTGFTRFAERLPPRAVTDVLNQILGLLTEAVFREGGTLDKFMGDAVMAFFGAPLEQPDHALRAVRAARDMLARMEEFNAPRAPDQRLGLHVGVNTGTVIVGDIGAEQRRDYTVIGDAVNVASRLESSVAQAGQVVIGAATHAAVQEAFDCSPLAPVVLKGRTDPFQPYLVLGPREPSH